MSAHIQVAVFIAEGSYAYVSFGRFEYFLLAEACNVDQTNLTLLSFLSPEDIPHRPFSLAEED